MYEENQYKPSFIYLLLAGLIAFRGLIPIGFMPGDLSKGEPWVITCHQTFDWLYHEHPSRQAHQHAHHHHHHQQHGHTTHDASGKISQSDCSFSNIANFQTPIPAPFDLIPEPFNTPPPPIFVASILNKAKYERPPIRSPPLNTLA